jgi:hypothetical protein
MKQGKARLIKEIRDPKINPRIKCHVGKLKDILIIAVVISVPIKDIEHVVPPLLNT